MPTKLLLVDDDDGFREMIQTWLERRYELTTAASAEQALQALEHITPDMIILDVMMPEVSGRQLFAQLRSDERYRSIPVLFLTAYHQVLSGQDEEFYGKSRVLLKPFRLEELTDQIEQMLADRESPPDSGS